MIDLLRALLRIKCPWCRGYSENALTKVHDWLYNRLVPRWWVVHYVGKPWDLSIWGCNWHWLFHVSAEEYVEGSLYHEMDCEMCLLPKGDEILGTDSYQRWRERV